MKTIKNKGVVYTGKVGANMILRPPRVSKACKKAPRLCFDGPMKNEVLWFGDTTFTSGVFTYRGETGRYSNGHWEPE